MQSKKIFIDTQFGGVQSAPISACLVTASAEIFYVEATDVSVGPVEILSKFQKTIGAVFVPTREVAVRILERLRQLTSATSCVELVATNKQVLDFWLIQINSAHLNSKVCVKLGNPNQADLRRIFELCAGNGSSHALIEALALAAAEPLGGLSVPLDTTKYGLLIGLKNSLSLRAFLRKLIVSKAASVGVQVVAI